MSYMTQIGNKNLGSYQGNNTHLGLQNNKRIAETLNLCPETVGSHLKKAGIKPKLPNGKARSHNPMAYGHQSTKHGRT